MKLVSGGTGLAPTHMARGIMTGIGFLGAGVIFKEGLTVRGLTTAASIWITATLGILYGVGFYFPAVLGTVPGAEFEYRSMIRTGDWTNAERLSAALLARDDVAGFDIRPTGD